MVGGVFDRLDYLRAVRQSEIVVRREVDQSLAKFAGLGVFDVDTSSRPRMDRKLIEVVSGGPCLLPPVIEGLE